MAKASDVTNLSVLGAAAELFQGVGSFYIGYVNTMVGVVFASRSQLMSVLEETEFFTTSIPVRLLYSGLPLTPTRNVSFFAFDNRDRLSSHPWRQMK